MIRLVNTPFGSIPQPSLALGLIKAWQSAPGTKSQRIDEVSQ